MIYYRVKPEGDNVVYKNGFLVQNELYTETEVNKNKWSNEFITKNLNKIEVSKKDTYFMFGARFCKQQGYTNKSI